MPRDYRVSLDDIIEAVERIETYTSGWLCPLTTASGIVDCWESLIQPWGCPVDWSFDDVHDDNADDISPIGDTPFGTAGRFAR